MTSEHVAGSGASPVADGQGGAALELKYQPGADAPTVQARSLPEGLVRALEEHGVGTKAALTLRVIERLAWQLYEHTSTADDESLPQKPRMAALAADVIWEVVQASWRVPRPSRELIEVLPVACQTSGLAYALGSASPLAGGKIESNDIYFTLSSVLRLLKCQYTKTATTVTIAESDIKMAVVRAIAQSAEHYQEGVRTGNSILQQKATCLAETMIFEAISRVPPRRLLIGALASTTEAKRPRNCQGRNEALVELFRGAEWQMNARSIADMLDDNCDTLESHGKEILSVMSAIQEHCAAYDVAQQSQDVEATMSIERMLSKRIYDETRWAPGLLSLRYALEAWAAKRDPARARRTRDVLRTLGILVKESTVAAALQSFGY